MIFWYPISLKYRRGKTIIAAYDVTNHTHYGLVEAGKGKSSEHSVVTENDKYAIYSCGGKCIVNTGSQRSGRRFSGNITPTLKVYDEDNTLMATLTAANDEAVHFECPAGYTSRIWFSWTVPEDFIGDSVKLVMTCDSEHTLIPPICTLVFAFTQNPVSIVSSFFAHGISPFKKGEPDLR